MPYRMGEPWRHRVSEGPEMDDSFYTSCPEPVNPRLPGQWQAEEGVEHSGVRVESVVCVIWRLCWEGPAVQLGIETACNLLSRSRPRGGRVSTVH